MQLLVLLVSFSDQQETGARLHQGVTGVMEVDSCQVMPQVLPACMPGLLLIQSLEATCVSVQLQTPGSLSVETDEEPMMPGDESQCEQDTGHI